MPQATALAVSLDSLLNYLKSHLYSLLQPSHRQLFPPLSLGLWISPLPLSCNSSLKGGACLLSGLFHPVWPPSRIRRYWPCCPTGNLLSPSPHAPGTPFPSPPVLLWSFLTFRGWCSGPPFFWHVTFCWGADPPPAYTLIFALPDPPVSQLCSCLPRSPVGTSNFSSSSVLLLHPFGFPASPLPPLSHCHHRPVRHSPNWSFCFHSSSFQFILNPTSKPVFLNFLMLLLCLQPFNISLWPMNKSLAILHMATRSFMISVPTSRSGFIFHLIFTVLSTVLKDLCISRLGFWFGTLHLPAVSPRAS